MTPNIPAPVPSAEQIEAASVLENQISYDAEKYEHNRVVLAAFLAARDLAVAEQATGQEQERWQHRFDFLARTYGVDGRGCDSGDPLDFTEAEVRGAINKLDDILYDVCKMIESKQDPKHILAFIRRPLNPTAAPAAPEKP